MKKLILIALATCFVISQAAAAPAALLKLIQTQAKDLNLSIDPASIIVTPDPAGNGFTIKASASYTGINWCTVGNKSDPKAKIHLASLVIIPGKTYSISGQRPMPESVVTQARRLVLIYPQNARQGRYSLQLSDYAEQNVHPLISQEIAQSFPGGTLSFFQLAAGETTIDWNSQINFNAPASVTYGEILLPSGLSVQIQGRAIQTDPQPTDPYAGWRASLLDQWTIQ